jgi:hypothetical protein
VRDAGFFGANTVSAPKIILTERRFQAAAPILSCHYISFANFTDISCANDRHRLIFLTIPQQTTKLAIS